MKKMLSILGLATLITLNYIITEETQTVMQEQDQIMQEIKENIEKTKQQPIDAQIKQDEIIPGINGKEIDIKKTYKELKKIGTYNEKYLKYKEIKPNQTIEKNYDKYIISGNKQKNTISLIFLVKENDKIENIINILEKNQVQATFFIEKNWLQKNKELTQKIINQNHTIEPLNKNKNYEITELTTNNKKQKYCYAKEKNNQNIKLCSQNKYYTIKPTVKINSLKQIKQKIEPGQLIELETNDQTTKELNLIINYIKTKGYKIETLEKHLSEKNTN